MSELALTEPKRNQHEIYFQPVTTILHAPWVPVPIITNASRIARKGRIARSRWRTQQNCGVKERDVKGSKSVSSRVGVIVLYFFSRCSLSVPSFIIPLVRREGETRVRARYPSLHPRICCESMRIDERQSRYTKGSRLDLVYFRGATNSVYFSERPNRQLLILHPHIHESRIRRAIPARTPRLHRDN